MRREPHHPPSIRVSFGMLHFPRTMHWYWEMPLHRRMRHIDHTGDPLLARQQAFYSHGRETLVNFIYNAHGRPNRY